MNDDTVKEQLADAKMAFDAGDYSKAEELLKNLPQNDLKVKSNLVTVQYLQQKLSIPEAIAALEAGSKLPSNPIAGNTAAPLTLLYEGHETALYNLAALYTQSGLTQKARALLLSLFEISADISLAVLTSSISLFLSVTMTVGGGGKDIRSKQDQETAKKMLKVVEARAPELNFAARPGVAAALSGDMRDLLKDVSDAGGVNRAVQLNDAGVLFVKEKKCGVATLCFANARKEVSALGPAASAAEASIIYNAGLCALQEEKYDAAMAAFLQVEDARGLSPLVWLRLTEAALGKAKACAAGVSREAYARQQTRFSSLLESGKVYTNFNFMLLPDAVTSDAKDDAPVECPAQAELRGATQTAAFALHKALALVIPRGLTACSAVESDPANKQLIAYAMLYWVTIELMENNYLMAAEVGQELLQLHDHHPLPAAVHATLLSYMVEALVHLNDPDRAMKVLRRATLSSLLVGPTTEGVDATQRCRVEALFINLAVTHILNGSWNQAHSILNALIAKIFEVAPEGSVEYASEKNVMFAYQLLAIFLELAQGNQEKAMDWLGKINWSI